jgi:hypothetical protein
LSAFSRPSLRRAAGRPDDSASRASRISARRDVLAALAQGRHAQLDHVEAVEQILAEARRLDHRLQVLVGGAEDAHIHGRLGRVAEAAELLLLDRPQQLDLHRQRQIAHLVEEQRAAVGRLEEAFPIGVGAGEGALAGAEELALHQVLGDRPAVDRHEGRRRGAELVDHPRRALLAAARFARDEDRRLAAGQLLDQRAHLHHRRRSPIRLELSLRAVAPGRHREHRLHQRPQLVDGDRLGEIVEGAGLEGRHRVVHAAEGGDHRHRQVAHVLGDVAHQLQAVAVGQAHVGQAQAVALLAEQAAGLGQAGRAVAGQAQAQQESSSSSRMSSSSSTMSTSGPLERARLSVWVMV